VILSLFSLDATFASADLPVIEAPRGAAVKGASRPTSGGG